MTEASAPSVASDQTQWLLRKKDRAYKLGTRYLLLGPYFTPQVRTMVEQSMLDAEDELCPQDSYWFALHESGEVKQFLGIDWVVKRSPDEEATLPDFLEDTEPDLVANAVAEAEARQEESTGMISIPKPESAAAPKPSGTTVKSRRPQAVPAQPITPEKLAQQFQRVNIGPELKGQGDHSAHQIFGIEKSRFWGGFLLACVALAFFGVLWVIKRLKT